MSSTCCSKKKCRCPETISPKRDAPLLGLQELRALSDLLAQPAIQELRDPLDPVVPDLQALLAKELMQAPTFTSRYCAPSELHCDSREDWFRSLFSQFSSVEAHIPCLPLRVRERERVFPPAWKSETLEDADVAFMFPDRV